MTNAQSKMEIPLPDENEVKKWCTDFFYPRTQAYVQDIMVNEIELWKPEIIMFVLVQATHIAMGFKSGKYNKYMKAQTKNTLDTLIDAFIYNYLHHFALKMRNGNTYLHSFPPTSWAV